MIDQFLCPKRILERWLNLIDVDSIDFLKIKTGGAKPRCLMLNFYK